MSNQELSPEESLELIQTMIHKARKQFTDNSFYFLMWGWVVMLASLTHYVIAKFTTFEIPYVGWVLTIPAFIASMIYGIHQGRRENVRHYTDRLYGWLWGMLGITMFTMVFFGEKLNWEIAPLTMLLAAVGTMVSGAMLRFRPLQIGGLAFWILGVVSFYMVESTQMLLTAAAVLVGYLVPGYLMRSEAKKNAV